MAFKHGGPLPADHPMWKQGSVVFFPMRKEPAKDGEPSSVKPEKAPPKERPVK